MSDTAIRIPMRPANATDENRSIHSECSSGRRHQHHIEDDDGGERAPPPPPQSRRITVDAGDEEFQPAHHGEHCDVEADQSDDPTRDMVVAGRVEDGEHEVLAVGEDEQQQEHDREHSAVVSMPRQYGRVIAIRFGHRTPKDILRALTLPASDGTRWIRTPFGPRARIQRRVDADRGERGDDDRRGDPGAAVGARRSSMPPNSRVEIAVAEERSVASQTGRCSAGCGLRECVRRPDRSARRRRGTALVPARRAGVRGHRLLGRQSREAHRRTGRRERTVTSPGSGLTAPLSRLTRPRAPDRRRGCGRPEGLRRSAPTMHGPTRPGSSRRRR